MKIRAIILAVVIGVCSNAFAQSITVGALPGNAFCHGDSVRVPFTASGTFSSKNSFTVQISDSNGSFSSYFYSIGSLRTTVSGVVKAVVANNIPLGRKYKLRIISSDPYVQSAPSNGTLTIGPNASTRFNTEFNMQYYLIGDTVRLENNSSNAYSYYWDFGPGAVPATSTQENPKFTFATPGIKEIRLTAFSAAGCGSTSMVRQIEVLSCFPKIPATATIDSDGSNQSSGNYIWVVPGGRVDIGQTGRIYFGEPGSTLKGDHGSGLFYVKAGASFFGSTGASSATAVYEDGSGLADTLFVTLLKCPDIEFDYSDAPPYKIEQAVVSRVSGSTVRVYPNPTTDRLTIEHKDNIIREISIRNALGAEQFFMHPEGLGTTSVDVSHLAAGLYFLDLLTDLGIETHKIVVQ